MRDLVGARTGRAARGAVLVAALAVVIVLAVAGAAGATSGAVAASPAGGAGTQLGAAPASGSIVVVRRSGGHDSLWSVDPVAKTAAQLIALPSLYRPARVEASPGGVRLAYLSMTPGPTVTVYDTQTGTLSSWSLAARGVKWVDSLAWVSNTKLLVAGRAKHTAYPFTDRVYQLNAVTGASRRFAGLSGTEPTVATAGFGPERLVFVRLSLGARVASGSPSRWVFERLYRLTLVGGAKPHQIGFVKYPSGYDIRRFHDPRLSPTGGFLITSTTGSDISVRYTVRSATTGKALRTVDTTLMGSDETAWGRFGVPRVAFWGTPVTESDSTMRLFVYNTATRSLTRSAALSNEVVGGLSWWTSNTDALLAYSTFGSGAYSPDGAELWTVDPAALSSPTDQGAGGLPVFMP